MLLIRPLTSASRRANDALKTRSALARRRTCDKVELGLSFHPPPPPPPPPRDAMLFLLRRRRAEQRPPSSREESFLRRRRHSSCLSTDTLRQRGGFGLRISPPLLSATTYMYWPSHMHCTVRRTATRFVGGPLLLLLPHNATKRVTTTTTQKQGHQPPSSPTKTRQTNNQARLCPSGPFQTREPFWVSSAASASPAPPPPPLVLRLPHYFFFTQSSYAMPLCVVEKSRRLLYFPSTPPLPSLPG